MLPNILSAFFFRVSIVADTDYLWVVPLFFLKHRLFVKLEYEKNLLETASLAGD